MYLKEKSMTSWYANVVFFLNLNNSLDQGVVPKIFVLMLGISTPDICY